MCSKSGTSHSALTILDFKICSTNDYQLTSFCVSLLNRIEPPTSRRARETVSETGLWRLEGNNIYTYHIK